MSINNNVMEKVVGLISKTRRQEIEKICLRKKIPLGILVAIAIEHEFERENPFSYDVSDPADKYLEHAFSNEANKIVLYMRLCFGMSLENMCLVRHDIGIPDKKVFLLAFRECVRARLLEPYTPKQSIMSKFKYEDDYTFWRVKGSGKVVAKKVRKEANQFETYHKLKKKYEGK